MKGRKSDHLGKTLILEDAFGAEEKQYIPCLALSSCSVKLVSEDPQNLTFRLPLFVRVRRRDTVYTMGKICKELQHLLLNSLNQLTKSISRHVFLAVSLAPFCQRANYKPEILLQPFQVLRPFSLALNFGIVLSCEHPAAFE